MEHYLCPVSFTVVPMFSVRPKEGGRRWGGGMSQEEWGNALFFLLKKITHYCQTTSNRGGTRGSYRTRNYFKLIFNTDLTRFHFPPHHSRSSGREVRNHVKSEKIIFLWVANLHFNFAITSSPSPELYTSLF